jgi:hypothetical protein
MDKIERRQARKLLKDLMPDANKRADELIASEAHVTACGRIGESALPWCRIENVWGVRVYPAPLGGWHADILLEGVPDGLPDALGTPAASPANTQGEAMAIAIHLIGMAIANSRRERPPEKPKELVFEFHGFEIMIPSEAFELAKPVTQADPRTPQMMHDRLAQFVEEVFPNGVTSDAMERLEVSGRVRLLTIACMSLAKGIFRYPQSTAKLPEFSSTMH